jgi:hypothetical protein
VQDKTMGMCGDAQENSVPSFSKEHVREMSCKVDCQ